jgi:hypothetical protein
LLGRWLIVGRAVSSHGNQWFIFSWYKHDSNQYLWKSK